MRRLVQLYTRQTSATLLQGEWRPYYAPLPTALGRVAAEEGDLDEAECLLREGLGLERAMGRPREIAEALEGLAAVAVAQGQPQRAVRLGAAATGLRASIGAPLSPYDGTAFERTLDAARASLGAGAFEAAWASAQATPWEHIVDEAVRGRDLATLPNAPPRDAAVPARPSLPHTQEAVAGASANKRLSRRQRQAWALEHLRTAGPLGSRAYATALAVSVDTALRDLQDLVDRGLVQAVGTTKDRRYVHADEAVGPPIHRTAP